MGFGKGSQGTNGTGYQLLLIIFLEVRTRLKLQNFLLNQNPQLFGVSLGQVRAYDRVAARSNPLIRCNPSSSEQSPPVFRLVLWVHGIEYLKRKTVL